MAADDDELDPRADPPDADRDQANYFWRAIRKTAPGPWASDHWAQTTKGFVGAAYVAIDMLGRALGSATFNLMEMGEENANPEGGAILKACRALPDDNAPKLVYADWLDEHGRPHQADLVRRLVGEGRGAAALKALATPGFHESDERWHPAPADHPGRKVFEEPNPRQSLSDVLYEWVLQESLTGTSYTWAVPNGYGEPCEQYVIPTVLTLPLPASEAYPNGAYRVQPASVGSAYAVLPGRYAQTGATIPAEQIVVSRRPHPWVGYDGYSPLQAAQTQIDVLRQIDVMRTAAAQNGCEPSLIITAPPGTKQEDVDRLQAKLDARFAGPWNNRKIMVIAGNPNATGQGLVITPWSKGPGELGGEEGWEQLVGFVSALFGVPKAVSGLVDAGSYAEFWAAVKQFYTRTLVPLTQRICGVWNRTLIWPVYGKRYRAQLDLPAIDDRDSLRADVDLLAKYQTIRVNELRTKLGMPPIDGPDGDKMVGEAEQEQNRLLLQAKLGGGPAGGGGPAAGGEGGPNADRPENPEGAGALPSRIGGAVKALEAVNGVLKAKDATGHEHKGRGPGGGQFTAGGGGGGQQAATAKKTRPGRDQRTNQERHEARRAERVKQARQKALAKAKAAPKPTPQAAAEAGRRMDEMGADRYEADIRGNTADRAASRKKLLAEFGDGESCPCVYCGLDLVDEDGPNLVTRDKIYVAREGGRYKHANLVPSCLDCNKRRSDKPFVPFLKRVGGV